MKEDNLNQKQLAELLEVSPAYVSKLLAGNQNLTLNTMIRYARKLGREFSFDLKKAKDHDNAAVHKNKASDQEHQLNTDDVDSTSPKREKTTTVSE